jgi:hypothetical protein
MKKINYIIAIASVAAMTLVSCKGVSESVSKSSGEEVSTEQTSDQATEGEEATEEVKIEDLKELTCDNYTIAIPEGWKASSKMVRSSCNMTLKENPHSTAMVNYTLYSENDLAESIAKRGCKAIPDITVGDKTYKVFENEKDGRYEYEAYVPQGEGFVTFRIMPGGTPMKGDELKEVMMKNLNDIINATTLK